jgi:hypothetical protein
MQLTECYRRTRMVTSVVSGINRVARETDMTGLYEQLV